MPRVYETSQLAFWTTFGNLPPHHHTILGSPMSTVTSLSAVRKPILALLCASALLLSMLAFAGTADASPKNGILKGNPSNKVLASEFLLLLKAKNQAGLKRFLDPAFLLQRGDGSYLNKKEYLENPSIVDEYKIRNIVATRSGNVRVIRYEANTIQTVNGNPVPGGWIPRLSTYVKSKGKQGRWTLISHANFLLPPAG
jgi:hypothetical protein